MMTDGVVVRARRILIVTTVAGLLLAYLGAFGTGVVPLGTRLGYWLVIMEASALIGIGVSTGIRGWGALVERPVLEGALTSLLIALPLTLVVLGATVVFFGAVPPLGGLPSTFVAVLVITCVVTAILYARGNGPMATAAVSEPAAAPVARTPKLVERLPQRLRAAELHALEAEDHYLRVHTSAGSDLILMRLGDAIAELEGVEGARTHRSWWVARDAVRSIRRADGRAELTLPGGVVAPVSRSFVAPLRERGWFG